MLTKFPSFILMLHWSSEGMSIPATTLCAKQCGDWLRMLKLELAAHDILIKKKKNTHTHTHLKWVLTVSLFFFLSSFFFSFFFLTLLLLFVKMCGCSYVTPPLFSIPFKKRKKPSVFNCNHLTFTALFTRSDPGYSKAYFCLILTDWGVFCAPASLSSLFKEVWNELDDFGSALV